jgi:hypothetical protein
VIIITTLTTQRSNRLENTAAMGAKHGARRLIPVCVGACVYGLGNTVEFSIWRITSQKMSVCLIFWCQ